MERVKISEKEFKAAWEKFIEQCNGTFYEELILTATFPVVYPVRVPKKPEIKYLTPAVLFFIVNNKNNNKHIVTLFYDIEKGKFQVICTDAIFTRKFHKILYPKEYDSRIADMQAVEYAIPVRDDCSPCIFWKEKNCKHVEHVKNMLKTMEGQIYKQLQEVREKFFSSEDHTHSDNFKDTLKRLSFKIPVLIEGEQGSGKTYTAYTVAKELIERGEAQFLVIGQGDNGIEATDLLGYYIKAPDGSLVWKDGVLSEAFRKAQKGKTILLFDEFYRLRDREKDIFVRALTVFPDGKLRLRTGRVLMVEDGVAQEEILEVPKENLWVIATTNVGSQFMIDEADPALQERFIILRKDTEEEELKNILASKCKEYGIDPSIAGTLIKFWKATKKLYNSGELSGYATTRTLVRAIELAPTKDKEGVKEALWIQRYLWIGRDTNGFPIPEQEEILKKLLETCF